MMNTRNGTEHTLRWNQLPYPLRYFGVLTILLALGGVLLYSMPGFLEGIQRRAGVRLHDPVLSWLQPHDFSGLIFALVYSGILISVVAFLSRPLVLMRFLMSVLLMYGLRMVAMEWVPLAPPSGLIPLKDVWVDSFAYGHHPITKDLFFSGHTAILLLAWLNCRRKLLKGLLLGVLILVAFLLMDQHVHYSLDVLGAFVASPLCYHAAAWVQWQLGWSY